MATTTTAECISPAEVATGDEIADELGARWMVVTSIRFISNADGGVYCFFGTGPDDRATFDAHETVTRRSRANG
jgi:hypothetical protein